MKSSHGLGGAVFQRVKWVLSLCLVLALKVWVERAFLVEERRYSSINEKGSQIVVIPNSVEEFSALIGGFRPLLASILKLRVAESFSEKDWEAIAGYYDKITALQPTESSHWRMPGWLLSVNGGREAEGKSLAERKYFYKRGKAFYETGIRKNPNDLPLRVQAASTYVNPALFPELLLAVEHYRKASEIARKQGAERGSDQSLAFEATSRKYERMQVYALARIPNEEERDKAYRLARRLFDESEQNHLPMLLCLLWVLQEQFEEESDRLSLIEIFRSESYAKRFLKRYLYQAKRLGYPMPTHSAK